MKRILKFGLLGLGIILTVIALFWFGRKQETFQLLSLAGCLLAGLAFLWILVGSGSARSKWKSVAIVAFSVAIYSLSSSYLVSLSYRIFLRQHASSLHRINQILGGVNGEVNVYPGTIAFPTGGSLTPAHSLELRRERMKIDVPMIFKDSSKIQYELWGFLDVRIRLYYALNGTKLPENQYRKITGSWYQ